VYARLRQCGLGDLCCLIHDSQTDKKQFVMELKQTYEAFLDDSVRAPAKSGKHSPTRVEALEKIAAEIAELEHFDRAMQSSPDTIGVSVRQLIGRCLELHGQLPSLSTLEKERLPDFATWSRCRDSITRYESALKEVQGDGIAANHPLSILAPRLAREDHPLELITNSTQNAHRCLSQLESTLSQSGIPKTMWDTLEKAQSLVDYARRTNGVLCSSPLGGNCVASCDGRITLDLMPFDRVGCRCSRRCNWSTIASPPCKLSSGRWPSNLALRKILTG
jgi:hypothetical protein